VRPIRYNVAASLDGYILDADGRFDWIPMDPAVDFAALFAKVDTAIMGRGSWEELQRAGGEWPFAPGTRVFVCSSSLPDDGAPGATIERGAAATLAARLRAEAGDGEIWLFGGAKLFASLLAAGQVDRVEITVVPVLLGSGTPLVASGIARTPLTLRDITRYPSGMVALHYDVFAAT
jgi:dihydrofolate reductase